MSPTVLSGVTMEMRAAREEVFGPVAPVLCVSGEEEALRVANDTELGLISAVITRDRERGMYFARDIQAGMTHVNDMGTNDDPNTAFGGEKMSGLGRFGGRWALDEFTTELLGLRAARTPDLPALGKEEKTVILALGALLVLTGLAGLAFGIYALLRGGRGQEGGGLGPIPERAIHAVAGIRMLIGGVVALLLGVVAILNYFSA